MMLYVKHEHIFLIPTSSSQDTGPRFRRGREWVMVKLQNKDDKIISLYVYNSTGNMVLFEPVNGNSFELRFEDLREGIYFVRTINDKNQVHAKSFNILR